MKWDRVSISTKTSTFSGLVVVFLLASTAFIIISRESALIGSIIKSNTQKEIATFEARASQEREMLAQRHQVNTKICAGLASYFIYNFDPDGLRNTIEPFLELRDIVAITVKHADGAPFAAVWKTEDKINVGDNLPENSGVDENLSFKNDILQGNKTIGRVTVFYSNRFVTEQLEASKKKSQEEIISFETMIARKLKGELFLQVMAICVVVVALMTTISVTLKLVVIRPLKKITEGLKDIAEGEGDLTKRLEIKNQDEVGELGKWFNTFITRIHVIIVDVTKSADLLNISSKNLAHISGMMTESSEQAMVKTDKVAANSVSMSEDMNSIAATMEQTSSNINEIASAVEEMTATINEIAHNSEKTREITTEAASQMNIASGQMGELHRAAQEIGQVIETINKISGKVNLLALNATIEASRAGDAGKGFAVVAREIKDLAQETTASTGEIKSRVKGIQSSSKSTIEQIGKISTVVNAVNDSVCCIATAVEEQSVTTKIIADNVAQTSHGTGLVTEKVKRSSSVVTDIATEISEVNQATKKITINSSHVNENAEELEQLALQLNQLVGKFKI